MLLGHILNLEELLSIPRVSLTETPVPPEDRALQVLRGQQNTHGVSIKRDTRSDQSAGGALGPASYTHERTHTHTHLPPLVNPPLSRSLCSHHGGNQNGNLR